MRRVRWFIREWMIGWHQGAKERHERAAQRHRVAEDRWRYRSEPAGCPGGDRWPTAEEAWVALRRRTASLDSMRLLEPPLVERCVEGHYHYQLSVREDPRWYPVEVPRLCEPRSTPVRARGPVKPS